MGVLTGLPASSARPPDMLAPSRRGSGGTGSRDGRSSNVSTAHISHPLNSGQWLFGMNETRAYHHGNLRQSLIDAALEAVEQQGYQALSLRDLAQVLEVSRGAPYRHFADRDALLRACACEGFRRLLDAHGNTAQETGTAGDRARAACRAFLAFAEAQPGLFLLMYDSGLLQQAEDEDELGALLHQVYSGIATTLREALEESDDDRLQGRLIAMWSTLYGYARLRQSNMLKPYMLGALSREQTEAAVITAAVGPLPGM
ncbi:TetR/AcrR family transcriptional regulator [Pseudomonas sp. BN606]|nr:TetR/AcrR family transcriptional regulator [Pseudomonas sp. BN606]